MEMTISANGSSEAYEAPRIDVLGTVTELTEWCVFGKSLGTPDYFDHVPIHNCSS